MGQRGLSLAVSWERDEAGMVSLRWTETRHEPVTETRRKGFGTQILEDFAAMALNGKSRQVFDDCTYTYHLSFAVRVVANDFEQGASRVERVG